MSKPFRVALVVLSLVMVGTRLARLVERAFAPTSPPARVASPLEPAGEQQAEALRQAREAEVLARAECEAKVRRAEALAEAESLEGR